MISIILFQFILWDSSYINKVEKNIIIHSIKRKTTILHKKFIAQRLLDMILPEIEIQYLPTRFLLLLQIHIIEN